MLKSFKLNLALYRIESSPEISIQFRDGKVKSQKKTGRHAALRLKIEDFWKTIEYARALIKAKKSRKKNERGLLSNELFALNVSLFTNKYPSWCFRHALVQILVGSICLIFMYHS